MSDVINTIALSAQFFCRNTPAIYSCIFHSCIFSDPVSSLLQRQIFVVSIQLQFAMYATERGSISWSVRPAATHQLVDVVGTQLGLLQPTIALYELKHLSIKGTHAVTRRSTIVHPT